ncbi:MAG: hypothetical protein ABH808_01165 [Candidatus Kuenenbacteria bacterium]
MMGQILNKAELEYKLNPEKALEQERGFFEKFKDKAKQVAGVFLLVSALSVGSDMVNKAYAQEIKQTTKIEQMQKQEEQKEKILWKSHNEKPAWLQFSLKIEKGYNLFIGKSEKYSTEKGSRDGAFRNAIEQANASNSGVIKNIRGVRVREFYTEQKQDKNRNDYWITFALVETQADLEEVKTNKQVSEAKIEGQPELINKQGSSTTDSNIIKETNILETKSTAQIKQVEEQQKKQEEKINKANLTESSKWSLSIIKFAREDIKKIKTAEDAEQLIHTYFNQFVSEYYIPTKGDLKEGSYGIITRDYTEDDSKLLLQKAQEMKNIIQELSIKFGIKAFEKRTEQINDIIKKLEWRLSDAGKKEVEILRRFEKSLQQQ